MGPPHGGKGFKIVLTV